MKSKTDKKPTERVELFVPRPEGRGEESLYIGINGKNYIIPRGKKCYVPPAVKAEYERRLAAEERLHKTVTEELEKSKFA